MSDIGSIGSAGTGPAATIPVLPAQGRRLRFRFCRHGAGGYDSGFAGTGPAATIPVLPARGRRLLLGEGGDFVERKQRAALHVISRFQIPVVIDLERIAPNLDINTHAHQ